jgi:ribosomal protein S18 acetylase RimI-like enzyme
MVATTGPPTPPVPAGLVVVEATTPEQLADFARVWSGGAGRAAIADLARLRSAPAFTNLLGLLDGVPVATAAAFHGPVAGEVQHVVTMAAARRRGIGAVLTAAAWAAIRGRGASAAVLTASPDGEGIYRRLGFRTVGTVRRYQWRPAW